MEDERPRTGQLVSAIDRFLKGTTWLSVAPIPRLRTLNAITRRTEYAPSPSPDRKPVRRNAARAPLTPRPI